MHTFEPVPETSTILIDLDKIISDPDQPRTVFPPEELQLLADSIKDHGLLQPIRVRPQGEQFIVLMGDRRFRAAGMAGLLQIEAIVHHAPLTDDERLVLQLVENVCRHDLNDIDKAQALKALQVKRKCSERALARELGMAECMVNRSLALLKQPQEVQDKIAKGEMAASALRAKKPVVNPGEQRVIKHESGLTVTISGIKSKHKKNSVLATALREVADTVEERGRTKEDTRAAA